MLTENDYAKWLFNTPGLGSKGVFGLLDKGYSCEEIYKCPDKELRTLLTAKKANALIRHRQNWNFELERKKLEEKDYYKYFISVNNRDTNISIFIIWTIWWI